MHNFGFTNLVNNLEFIRPFGPTIAKVTMPQNLIEKLNIYVDKVIEDDETIKKLDEGDGIYYDDLGIAVSLEGIDGPMLDEILDSLTDQGLIFQPRFNHYKEA